MPFSIIRNDITKLAADAIVNAANSRLLAGGGVCGAIFAAAGYDKLQRACNKIGNCATGSAVITKGYALPAKYIIHTVGPVYGADPKNEEEQLYNCYKNSLELAKAKNLTSIAFPLISSGIYGYPKTEALRIATKAIRDFLKENDMDIYLVVYDRNSFVISQKLFESVKSYINENLILQNDSVDRNTAESQYNPDFIKKLSEKFSSRTQENKKPENLYDIKQLSSQAALEDLVAKSVETFSQMLLRLIDEKGMTDVEVYKRANIDRKLFSKIRGKNYTPRKHTVIALAISLRLNIDEAESLLRRAGFAFSECDKFDVIIEYFIVNDIYDIFEINETLFYFGQPLLGA